MSATHHRLPIYSAQPDPEDDIYEAELSEDGYPDQFLAALFSNYVHDSSQPPPKNRFAPPPPNPLPARPAYTEPDTGYTNIDDGDDFIHGFRLPHRQRTKTPSNRRRFFFFIGEGPGGLLCMFHLPKRVIAAAIFALFLMFATLYNVPDAWEVVFGFFGLV
jgi:hypothetical protein